MAKVIRHRNPNATKVRVLSSIRILCIVIPLALCIVLVLKYEAITNPQLMVMAAVLVVVLFAFIFISRVYRPLLAGFQGEQMLIKTAKRSRADGVFFANLPLQDGSRRSEIDLLYLSSTGLLIVEVKNYSGVVQGRESSKEWTQTKTYIKNNKPTTTTKSVPNPIIQINRQHDILGEMLMKKGIDAHIDEVLYFVNPNSEIQVSSNKCKIIRGEKNLQDFLKSWKGKSTISDFEIQKIVDIFKG